MLIFHAQSSTNSGLILLKGRVEKPYRSILSLRLDSSRNSTRNVKAVDNDGGAPCDMNFQQGYWCSCFMQFQLVPRVLVSFAECDILSQSSSYQPCADGVRLQISLRHLMKIFWRFEAVMTSTESVSTKSPSTNMVIELSVSSALLNS